MKKRWCAAVLLALSLAATGGRTAWAEKVYQAYRVNKPVQIDGVLDEAAWKTLVTANGFLYKNHPDKLYVDPRWQTQFQIGYDDQNLYLAIQADEPGIVTHVEGARKDKDTQKVNWNYQLMEFLVDVPGEKETNYYQFAYDILGYKICYRADLAGQPFNVINTKWAERDFKIQTAIAIHPDKGYTMELAFPLEQFGVKPPKNLAHWGFQVGRHGVWVHNSLHWGVAGWSEWVPMALGKWRAVEEHGVLEFVDEVLWPEYADKYSRKLNAAYSEWQATCGEAMKNINAIMARTQSQTNLCQGCIRPFQYWGGQGWGVPASTNVNSRWQDGNTADKIRTAVLQWKTNVTFNCQTIEWGGTTDYGMDYMLEYWDGREWRLAYKQAGNMLSKSACVFPAVTTDKVRFSATRFCPHANEVVVRHFGLYLLGEDSQPKEGGSR